MHATDDVLWTKLHVPHRPTTFVARPRLAVQLDEALARAGVTLVSAPAGSGKSVLLADACDRRTGPAAWVSLDENDNDPVRFWRHVAAALDQALGDASQILAAVQQSTRGSGGPGNDAVVGALVSAVLPDGADVALILDDYHLIETEAVHASVRFLLEHAPPALHVVIASRADPPFHLPRLRVEGRLTEIRIADLRFTTPEGGELLRNVARAGISEEIAAALTERTEGWVAGLQLAGLSLAGRDDVESFTTAFTGQHRFVLDYLAEEVLDRQAVAVKDFLLQTSILDRLCGSLCDAVTGRRDGQQMLEAIESGNLFVTPLDDVRGWWRYHQLFADLLRVRLRQQRDDHVAELHRRASGWYDARGDVNQAIRHALDAGDLARAAQLIEQHADELLLRREGATLQRWFDRFPPGLLDSRRLALAQARIAIYGGRVDDAEDLLDRADALATTSNRDASRGSARRRAGPLSDPDPTATLLRAFVAHMRGDADHAIALASSTVSETDDSSFVALIARWHLATAPWLRGQVDEAEPAVAANVDAWRDVGEHDRAAWTAHYLGRIQVEQGRLDAALATYHEVLERDADQTELDAPATGVAHVGIAEIAYQRNELASARLHARLGISKCAEFIYTQALADGWSVLARIDQAEGDAEAAREAARTARELAPTDVADLLNPVPAQMAHLALLRGDTGAAERWAAARHLTAGTELRHSHEPAHLTQVRILLAQARPSEALDQLDRRRQLALDDGRTGNVIEIDVLRARALAAHGDDAGALVALAGAVRRAAPQGHVRVFADEGEPMASLLDTLVAAPPTDAAHHLDPTYVETLIEACRGASRRDPTDERELELVVPLTDRELDVLAEIARGKPNKDIAAELFISLNTVKKHVSHIFDKLGVTNRTAAVVRARELGLVREDEITAQ